MQVCICQFHLSVHIHHPIKHCFQIERQQSCNNELIKLIWQLENKCSCTHTRSAVFPQTTPLARQQSWWLIAALWQSCDLFKQTDRLYRGSLSPIKTHDFQRGFQNRPTVRLFLPAVLTHGLGQVDLREQLSTPGITAQSVAISRTITGIIAAAPQHTCWSTSRWRIQHKMDNMRACLNLFAFTLKQWPEVNAVCPCVDQSIAWKSKGNSSVHGYVQ